MMQRVGIGPLVLAIFVVQILGLPRWLVADAAWRVGLARVKVTPDEPVRMSGYASRTQPSQGVAWDLYAKALALEDRAGQRAVLITCDVIGFTAAFAEPTCRRISDQTGLQRHQILLNASHTHTGPTIALDGAQLDFPPDQLAATLRYSRALQDKLVQLVTASLERLEPAVLSWGVGVAPFVMNRREFTERGVILGVNPRGLADRSVPLLRIDTPQGDLRAVVFGTACHNTTLTGRDLQLSGDFAGYAQAHIEQRHPGAQAMFMQGCGGDANPFPRGSEEIAKLHGRTLGEEVLRVLAEPRRPVGGPLSVELSQVELPLRPVFSKSELDVFERERGGWRRFVAGRMRELLDAEGKLPSSYRTPIAVWQFGGDLTLVALPGEVVVDYVALLEDSLGPRNLWVSAYANDVFGYLPSRRVLEQGGYETRGLYAGGIGLFAPSAEQIVIEEVERLAAKAGRPETK